MDDRQLGRAYRAIRIRIGRTQDELGAASGTSRDKVARIEQGRSANISLGTLRAVAAALDADFVPALRWRGGDLERVLNARHAAMHDAIAELFGARPGWLFEPEVSFAFDRERGVIDAVAWHARTRTLLLVELKTELVDVNELMATMDIRLRLAPRIARGRGWFPAVVGCWVAVAESRTNRRCVARHQLTLRSKFPDDGHALRAWLRRPSGPCRALSFLTIEHQAHGGASVAGQRTVRRARSPAPDPLVP